MTFKTDVLLTRAVSTSNDYDLILSESMICSEMEHEGPQAAMSSKRFSLCSFAMAEGRRYHRHQFMIDVQIIHAILSQKGTYQTIL